MKCIYRLENIVQHYAWGSRTAVPALLGISNPHDEPMAEIWMGAHPKAPSLIVDGGEKIPLDRFIDGHPGAILGERVAKAFGPRLPYLFKILSAGEPLSIQAHPNLAQAAEGFARENREGIPVDAPERNYRDANHKPEIICALTPFSALRGFRPFDEIGRLLGDCPDAGLKAAARLASVEKSAESLRSLFLYVQGMGKDAVNRAASSMAVCDGPGYGWVGRLLSQYPGDPGVFAPLYLNLVELAPGEAMFLPAGELHAYLEGTGIELMANSDNVLRGGLTVKHVDVKELLSVLTFASGKPGILNPVPQGAAGTAGSAVKRESYESGAREFTLHVIPVNGSGVIPKPEGPEIIVCTEGSVSVTGLPGSDGTVLAPGDSLLAADCASGYRFSGRGKLYAASVGHENLG